MFAVPRGGDEIVKVWAERVMKEGSPMMVWVIVCRQVDPSVSTPSYGLKVKVPVSSS